MWVRHLYVSSHYICVDLGALFPEEVLMYRQEAFVWQYYTCEWNRSHQQTAKPRDLGQLLLLMVWFVFQACSFLKSGNNKSSLSYLGGDLCTIPKHSPSCREVVWKRGWWKDAKAVLVCFAVSCDSGIATHSPSMYCSQRVFFIAIAVSVKVLGQDPKSSSPC